MSSLVNRFKSGAGKAAFEADKLRRLQGAQSALKPPRAEVERLYNEMGKAAYLIFTQGDLDRPELVAVGERLAAAQERVKAAETEVERIRAEEYVEPVGATQSGLVCPNGHGMLAAGASFCQMCGAAGVSPAPPTLELCQSCGATLEPSARFCANCGTPVERCASCHAPLLPGAVFCAECGTPVRKAAEPPPKSTAPEPPASAQLPTEWTDLPAKEPSDEIEDAGEE